MDFSNLSTKITTPGDRNCTYKVEGREDGQGYLSTKNNASELGLIVIQEWWGLNQSLVITCDTLAEQGFRALCPDIYRGKVAKDHEEAGHLLSGLDWPGAIADVIGAAKHLRSLGCKKVGITGFCMGGALSIATLANTDQIDAGCPFYGIPDLTHINLANVKQPVIAHFGENDQLKGFSSPEDAKKLEAKAQELGLVNFSVKIWPNVGHAFMNQDSKYYSPETAQHALQEIVAFLKKWLV